MTHAGVSHLTLRITFMNKAVFCLQKIVPCELLTSIFCNGDLCKSFLDVFRKKGRE